MISVKWFWLVFMTSVFALPVQPSEELNRRSDQAVQEQYESEFEKSGMRDELRNLFSDCFEEDFEIEKRAFFRTDYSVKDLLVQYMTSELAKDAFVNATRNLTKPLTENSISEQMKNSLFMTLFDYKHYKDSVWYVAAEKDIEDNHLDQQKLSANTRHLYVSRIFLLKSARKKLRDVLSTGGHLEALLVYSRLLYGADFNASLLPKSIRDHIKN